MLAKESALPRSGSVAGKLTALEAHQAGWLALPPGYVLEHGANVLLLCRRDGSVAATFSAKGTTQRRWPGPPRRPQARRRP